MVVSGFGMESRDNRSSVSLRGRQLIALSEERDARFPVGKVGLG